MEKAINRSNREQTDLSTGSICIYLAPLLKKLLIMAALASTSWTGIFFQIRFRVLIIVQCQLND